MALNDTARYAYNYLKKKHGFSDLAASSAIGNGQQESSWNLNARNKGDGRDGSDSVGVFQWNGDRAKGLVNYGKQTGRDPYDIDNQLDYYAWEQTHGGEQRAGNMMKNASTLNDAVAGGISYERPQGFSWDNPSAGHGYDNRLAYAKDAYRDFSGNDPDAVLGSKPTAAPTQTADTSATTQPKEVKYPGLKAAGEAVGSAMGDIGFSGTGKEGDPRKLWGMELEGDNGLLTDLGGFQKAFAAQDQGPQITGGRGGGGNSQVQVSFDIPATTKQTQIDEEEMKKRRGGLAGFGGFTRRA